MESRTQGSRPRPRTQKKSEAKAKDSLLKDRPSRGQGQECWRPRPRTKEKRLKCSPKKEKKVFKKFFSENNGFQKKFSGDRKKKVFKKIFHAISEKQGTKTSSQIFRKVSSILQPNFKHSKNSAVLEPRTGQFSRT